MKPVKQKVKLTATITTTEVRVIEVTPEELQELRDNPGKFIEEAMWDDVGEVTEQATDAIDAGSWEIKQAKKKKAKRDEY